jgi:hypothetical protein
MNVENVIPELHRQRENLARACGYDVKKLVEHYRRRETGRKAGGHRLVSFVEAASQPEVAAILRDAPRKKGK